MKTFPFVVANILHFRFNAGLVYLAPLTHFKNSWRVLLHKGNALNLNPLFSNSYMGLTEQ